MRDRPAGCSTCASSLCGALCGNGRSPAAGIDGLLVAIGRRRGFGAAPAMMVVMRSGTTNTTLAATQRHPCRSGMVTADCARSRSCSESVVAPAALNDHQNLAALIIFAALYARVRRWDADDGTGGAMRGRGWRATAIGANKAIADPTALSKVCTKSLIPTNVYASAIGLCNDSIITQSSKPSNSDF